MALALIFYMETIALYFIYKPGLGDVNLIITGGRNILGGINPYERFDFGNSPSAGIFFYFISLLIPNLLLSVAIPLLNATGYLLFTRLVCQELNLRMPVLIVILPFLAPFRSVISAAQISGIVILLMIPWLYHRGKNSFSTIVQVPLAGFALELKPQIALSFLIYSAFRNPKDRRLWWLGGIVLAAHTVITLCVSRRLDLQWISSLRLRSERSLEDSPQVSGWKFLNYAYDDPTFWRIMSFFCYLLITIAIYRYKSKIAMLFLGSVAPLTLTYQHLYDLIPLVIFLILIVENRTGLDVPLILFTLYLNLPIDMMEVLLLIFTSFLASRIRLPLVEILKHLFVASLIGIPLFWLRSEAIEIQYSYLSSVVIIPGIIIIGRYLSCKRQ